MSATLCLPGRPVKALLLALVCVAAWVPVSARAALQGAQQTAGSQPPAPVAAEDYVIGADDVLSVVFWREKELSVDAVVRPDGKISLPLMNEVMAAGLTPEQLRDRITKQASAFVKDPQATVVVKEINSRKVYITGQVEKPGAYPLTTRLSVMQLIAMAGGLRIRQERPHRGDAPRTGAGGPPPLRLQEGTRGQGRRPEPRDAPWRYGGRALIES